ncbi:MAG TPA: hypothetical protein H9825_00530 [Candidatus Sphingobacterium stercorigallinarum]|nr:hypothetical protein [Candidatus Sphingobacterium stercorigallinarum]
MKIVVIGGSGATGRELVLQLLADPRVESVVALVRKQFFSSNLKLREVVVDFDHLKDYANEIQGDIAFSTLGTTLKQAGGKQAQWRVDHDYQVEFADIARTNKMFTFVLLSSANAAEKSLFFYSRMKGAVEKELVKLNFPKLVIVQPGPIDRPGSDRSGEKLGVSFVRFLNRFGLFKTYRPITTISLAEVLIQCGFSDTADSVERIGLREIYAMTSTE